MAPDWYEGHLFEGSWSQSPPGGCQGLIFQPVLLCLSLWAWLFRSKPDFVEQGVVPYNVGGLRISLEGYIIVPGRLLVHGSGPWVSLHNPARLLEC